MTVRSERSRFRRRVETLIASLGFLLAAPAFAQSDAADAVILTKAAAEAEAQLRQSFTNLQFEAFGPSPVKGPVYQASAGGRILYYAPESEHLLFASIFDKNGVNLTALAQEAGSAKRLGGLDKSQALAIGPEGAPEVIEFTDPDCPYCRSLDRYWAAKAAEGKPVRRLIFFVSGIHPRAAAKAEHIFCSSDREAAFKAVYGGAWPAKPLACAEGAKRVAAHAAMVAKMGISGTPTLVAGGKLISGFQQGEIEAFLNAAASKTIGSAKP